MGISGRGLNETSSRHLNKKKNAISKPCFFFYFYIFSKGGGGGEGKEIWSSLDKKVTHGTTCVGSRPFHHIPFDPILQSDYVGLSVVKYITEKMLQEARISRAWCL